MPKGKAKCKHDTLQTTVSPHAATVGYNPYTTQQLFTAATGSRMKVSSDYVRAITAFPAPLVLPGDELSYDPKYPPQSFKSWLNLHERNHATQKRKTVYVAAPPKVVPSPVAACQAGNFMKDWDVPRSDAVKKQVLTNKPTLESVMSYLQAFFHGIEVKQLPEGLEYVRRGKGDTRTGDSLVNLRSVRSSTTTAVRVRHLDSSKDVYSPYLHQLNLNDILDHAMAILPDDAYCLLFLVDHDLFEEVDDDFCCGRAYGGSRIAVVSSAQYQPALDEWHGVEIAGGHFWPGSHCKNFVDGLSGTELPFHHKPKRQNGESQEESRSILMHQAEGRSTSNPSRAVGSANEIDKHHPELSTPLEIALDAHRRSLQKKRLEQVDLASLYLRRVALTASHELLHCFGLDHCVYLACAMQATASVLEDSRQPPYLCLVCENKLASALIDSPNRKDSATAPHRQWFNETDVVNWKKARNNAVAAFCAERGDRDVGFTSLGAWTVGRLSCDSQ